MTSSARLARRVAAVAGSFAAAALAAGCASAGDGNSAGSPASTAAPTPAAPATSAAAPISAAPTAPQTPPGSPAAPACSPSDLSGTVPSGAGGAAAGSAYYPLNLTNTSNHPCYLYGYPGVSFVTGPSGSQIGAAAIRNPAVTPATVVLGPGRTAHVTLQVVDALNYSRSACQPVTAHWLKVYPPGQYSALYVKFSAMTCSATLPAKLGSPLSVDAVKAGTGHPGEGL
jgi:Domain of unknown function (DUF4232)